MSLAALIASQIAAEGPIGVDRYMALALAHPTYGYYMRQDPFGSAGDFITSPEISQMFGELIGLALAQNWLDQGAPKPFGLAELGPGRGTLMADVLRATRTVPGFHDAMRVHLVEASPHLREIQSKALERFCSSDRLTWHDTVQSLPDVPLWLVANEFFDALPIRQFIRTESGWSERMIGLAPEAKEAEPSFIWGRGPEAAIDALRARVAQAEPRDLVETCAPAEAIMAQLAGHIARFGGAALIIDYGDWQTTGSTFQAVRAHKPVDPLSDPGQADLTAHVQFESLAKAATSAGLAASSLTEQGLFLNRLGIAQRAERLAQSLSGSARSSHDAALERLTSPSEMGTLFKVLGCVPPHAAQLPGLSP
ncbi:MAG: SAM-dependent methyltransferase [Pseudomonadota bacterium]